MSETATNGVSDELPWIIQGGMGVGVSNWVLANAVSRRGQLGVVSGTCVDSILVRRLQDGDIGGHVRRAMAHFPIPHVAESILQKFFLPDGRPPRTPYKALPMYRQSMSAARQQITIMASFVEVWLAREGHSRPVGINLLTKVQMPNLPTLYGAMLAGVGYVLMGAGIPREIPGVLDKLANHEPVSIKFDVEGLPNGETEYLKFDPREYWTPQEPLYRPRFLAIISANSLAMTLARKATGRVDGFVIEGPTAGGHNAPPRGDLKLNERGEPIYGERDVVDLVKMKELGLPFWLAGSAGSPEKLQAARDAGAAGIQVGTLFAYCEESGFSTQIKRLVRQNVIDDKVSVRTDPRASPTGYPFKIVEIDGVNSRAEGRKRCCDLGYLRTAYREESGRLGYRCAAEPIDTYVKRGGAIEDTEGRKCLCNGLFANIGHAQVRDDDEDERPIITSGDEIALLAPFFRSRPDYTAADVIEHLLSYLPSSNGHTLAATNGNGAYHSNGHGSNGNGVAPDGNGVSSNGHGVSSNGHGAGNGTVVTPAAPGHTRVPA
jgi:NAD(P)H-dependent flavin oxidoreductase YrpB (nitropropane dioxygenase family)